MERIWDRLAGMGIRTVIGAAGWAQIEPVEGTFDFSTVDAQVEQARARGMRLVLIWFGAFKNAGSTYAPGWVRRDVERSGPGPCAMAHSRPATTNQHEGQTAMANGRVRGVRSIELGVRDLHQSAQQTVAG